MTSLFALLTSVLGIVAGFILFNRFLKRKNVLTGSYTNSIQLIFEGMRSYFRWQLHPFVSYYFIFILFLILIYRSIHEGMDWTVLFSFSTGVLLTAFIVYATALSTLLAQRLALEKVEQSSLFRNIYGSSASLSIIGVSITFWGAITTAFYLGFSQIIYYILGTCFVAVFAYINGGIFSKSFEIGKNSIAADIPELSVNDKRNPAFWGEKVGACVSDAAGKFASLLISYLFALLGSVLVLYYYIDQKGLELSSVINLGLYPFILYGIGLIAAILGIVLVLRFTSRSSLRKMIWGVYITIVILGLGTFLFNWLLPPLSRGVMGMHRYGILISVLLGLLGTAVVSFVSEYYGSSSYRPVKRMAEKSQYSPINTILGGARNGLKSLFIPVITILVIIFVSHTVAGYYGIIIAGIGALAISPILVIGHWVSVISYNTKTILELEPFDQKQMGQLSELDQAGDVVDSISQGYLAMVSILASLVVVMALGIHVLKQQQMRFDYVTIFAVLGAIMPYVFFYYLVKGINETSVKVYDEANLQWQHTPYLKEAKAYPDVKNIVRVIIRKSQVYSFVPVMLALLLPFLIGRFFGLQILFVFLLGSLISGLFSALVMSNTGVLLHNVKKYVEAGNFGGVGTSTYQSVVIGDMIGSPLKDAIGPAVDLLIKIMVIFSLVLFPLIK